MARSTEIPRNLTVLDTIKDLRAPKTQTEDGYVPVKQSGDDVTYSNAFEPDFQNSWANVGDNNPPLRFWIDNNGIVRLEGSITGGEAGTVVFTLPDGFRPEYSERFIGAISVGGDIATIQVDPSGDVTVVAIGIVHTPGSIDPTAISPGTEGTVLKVVSGVATWSAVSDTTSGPSSSVQEEISFGIASDVGTSDEYSRGDHTHGTPDDPVPAHVALADPHTQYQKESEKGSASGYAALDSGGKVPQAQLGSGSGGGGSKFLADDQSYKSVTSTDATPASTVTDETTFGVSKVVGTSDHYAREDHTHGTPVNPVTAHVADSDPHTQYQKESEKGAASGYASLDSGGHVPVAQLGSGTPDGTKFLRDDGTFQTPSGGGGGGGSPSPSTVTIVEEEGWGQEEAVGTSLLYARADHTHGTPDDPIPPHVSEDDPHGQYVLEASIGEADGVAGLDGTALVPTDQIATGTPDGTKFLADDRTWRVVPGSEASGIIVRKDDDEIGDRPAINLHQTDIIQVTVEDDSGDSEVDVTIGLRPADVDGYVATTVDGEVVWAPSTGAGSAIYTGSGTPEGSQTGIVGDFYIRSDGDFPTTIYEKTSGTGNTGWTARGILGGYNPPAISMFDYLKFR